MSRKRIRRTVVLTLIVALVGTGSFRPRPARALDTAILVIGSIAAYAAFVVAGTIIYRRSTTSAWGLVPQERPPDRKRNAPRIQFAPRCKPAAGGLTLACW
jgi:hypothetical protein